jgi:hypothetical protein
MRMSRYSSPSTESLLHGEPNSDEETLSYPSTFEVQFQRELMRRKAEHVTLSTGTTLIVGTAEDNQHHQLDDGAAKERYKKLRCAVM